MNIYVILQPKCSYRSIIFNLNEKRVEEINFMVITLPQNRIIAIMKRKAVKCLESNKVGNYERHSAEKAED